MLNSKVWTVCCAVFSMPLAFAADPTHVVVSPDRTVAFLSPIQSDWLDSERLWNSLSAPATEEGGLRTKRFATEDGRLELECAQVIASGLVDCRVSIVTTNAERLGRSAE